MRIIAIGASAGGPQAIAEILSALPARLPAAVLIVQHVNREFSAGLAGWLARQTALPVSIAAEGQKPEKGRVYMAGTDEHLIVKPDFTFSHVPGLKAMPYCPSIDIFFRSLALCYTGPAGCRDCLAVLLTGMGKDGAAGLLELRRRGCHTIAQDEKTSVIYGMPKAARDMGAAAEILPLHQIAPAILKYVQVKPETFHP
ncbi:MAG: chemotaxis protein CheB [Desulfobacterales bacterium]